MSDGRHLHPKARYVVGVTHRPPEEGSDTCGCAAMWRTLVPLAGNCCHQPKLILRDDDYRSCRLSPIGPQQRRQFHATTRRLGRRSKRSGHNQTYRLSYSLKVPAHMVAKWPVYPFRYRTTPRFPRVIASGIPSHGQGSDEATC